jgi:hypothetical protein
MGGIFVTEKLTPKEAAAKWGMSPAELAWRQRQHRVTGSAFKDDPTLKRKSIEHPLMRKYQTYKTTKASAW